MILLNNLYHAAARVFMRRQRLDCSLVGFVFMVFALVLLSLLFLRLANNLHAGWRSDG